MLLVMVGHNISESPLLVEIASHVVLVCAGLCFGGVKSFFKIKAVD